MSSNIKLFLIFNSMLIFFFIFINCGGTKKTPTFTVNEYAFDEKGSRIQTKSNVTIEANPLSPSNTYDYPELFSFSQSKLPESLRGLATSGYFPEDLHGKSWCYTFGAGQNMLTAFKVKITNKTPHILRMKDARIYLVIDGEDPIAAVTKVGNQQLYGRDTKEGKVYFPKSYEDQDNSFVHWITYYELKWDNEREKGFLSLAYPLGIASQVIGQNKRNYKFINDVSREILPDFSYEGILLFPALVSWDKVQLMFYDITTKTDAAGNPIEKTKFEFTLKLDNIDMWYDPAEKKWKKGLPPKPTASSVK